MNHENQIPEETKTDGPGTAILSQAETDAYNEVAEHLKVQEKAFDVHVVALIDPDTFERKVCYLKEPNYMTKIAVMGKAVQFGIYPAAEELRQISVIKESSDAITYGESPECDKYKLGVVNYCIGMIEVLQNSFKKK